MWSTVLCSLLFLAKSFADRELIPMEPPGNLTLLNFEDKDVVVQWDSIEPESVRGTFKGYLLRVWNHALSQVYAIPPDITKTSVQFFPYSKNFMTVAVRNDKYVGPRSNTISFDAPQTEPNMPFLFEHYQLGSSSVLLQWNKPTQANGILLGYNVYCSEMKGDTVDEKSTVRYFVSGSDNFQAKLTGLKEGIKYFVQIGAVNCAGESDHKVMEIELETQTPQKPSMPTFKYHIDFNITDKNDLMKAKCYETSQYPKSDGSADDFYILNEQESGKVVTHSPLPKEWIHVHSNCLVNTLIKWIPDVTNIPGEHFYVKYRIKGEPEFLKTAPELEEDYTILENFNACVNYEIILVAVDGDFETESEVQETPAIMFMFRH
nr:neuroglian-like isoform X1 [Leptinotarsa decemlineata]